MTFRQRGSRDRYGADQNASTSGPGGPSASRCGPTGCNLRRRRPAGLPRALARSWQAFTCYARIRRSGWQADATGALGRDDRSRRLV